jgi:FixJ family two-component response regulator
MNVIGTAMISIVDDDESVRTATKALLRSAGYEVVTLLRRSCSWSQALFEKPSA